jgi:hypothetical protein
MLLKKNILIFNKMFRRCHGLRQYTSPQLNDVQNVAKSEDNFPNVIALADSLSMFSVIRAFLSNVVKEKHLNFQ